MCVFHGSCEFSFTLMWGVAIRSLATEILQTIFSFPQIFLHIQVTLFACKSSCCSSLPPQCLLTSRPARCPAPCSWAQASSFTVRTNWACLLPPTAGTKTPRLWRPQQTLRTVLTQTRAHWWEHTKIHKDSCTTHTHTLKCTWECINSYAHMFRHTAVLSPCSCLQKFKSVSKTDAGMYRCESSNNVGAPKSCVAQQLKVVDCKLAQLLT